QYQVVVGNKVNAIYEEVMHQLNNDQAFDSTEGVVENDSNSDFLQLFRNGFNQFIGIITGSMMPVIGLLAGAGIIKGLQASLVTFDLLQDSSQSYLLINTIADGIFYFLPVILGFTAAQKLKVNPIVLAVVGAILIHPNIVTIASSTAAKVAIFGIEFPIMNYTASVFPILVAAWLATYVEKFLKKIVPLVISSIVSPIVEVLVLSLAVLLIIGPIITIISDGLAFGISTIFDFNTIIGGAVYCALFPVLVVFGMHWPLIPIIVNDLTVNGF
ncbi:beta-xylosidase, partial [Listeria monocytogenes]|nr:beta-xylosidase [Listeria monocytogenes]